MEEIEPLLSLSVRWRRGGDRASPLLPKAAGHERRVLWPGIQRPYRGQGCTALGDGEWRAASWSAGSWPGEAVGEVQPVWSRMSASTSRRRADAPYDNCRGGVMLVRRRSVQIKHHFLGPHHRRRPIYAAATQVCFSFFFLLHPPS
jgi:hypothetical protein